MSLYDLYQKYKKRYVYLKRMESIDKHMSLYGSRMNMLYELVDSDKLNEQDCGILYDNKNEGTINSKKYKYVTRGGQGAIYFLFFEECCVALKLIIIDHFSH